MNPPLPVWLTEHRPARNDALAALVFAVLWFGAIQAGVHLGWWYPSPRWSWNLAGVFTTGVLLTREVWPGGAFWAGTVVFGALYCWFVRHKYYGGGMISEFHLLPVVLGAYTVTARGRLKTWVVLLTAWAVTGAVFVHGWGVFDMLGELGEKPGAFDISGLLVLEVAVAAIVLAGRASYRQGRASQSARRRNELLRKAETQQVVTAERTRIARELHDLVAHHISAVVIRAQAADRVADSRPGELRDAVRWIAANGQETLTAMRHVVRVLRSAEEGTDLTPQATLAELPEIASRMEAVGLPVSLVQPEEPLGNLPAAVELAAVRIVQEALTNVLVHARATRAVVEVHPEGDTIRIEIHDDGTAGAPPTEPIEIISGAAAAAQAPARKFPASRKGGGHGLIGMRERATSTGGSLRIGTSPLGGWLITAVLGVRLGGLPVAPGATA